MYFCLFTILVAELVSGRQRESYAIIDILPMLGLVLCWQDNNLENLRSLSSNVAACTQIMSDVPSFRISASIVMFYGTALDPVSRRSRS